MPGQGEEIRKVGLRFVEEMSGYLTEGETDFEKGESTGKDRNTPCVFGVTISIDDVADFTKLSGRTARLTGTVSCPVLGKNLPIRNGVFGLFRPDPATAKRHMTYSFGFTGNDGKDYFLSGYKVISDDPKFDVLEDMTKLFTRIYRGIRGRPSLGFGNPPLQDVEPAFHADFLRSDQHP